VGVCSEATLLAAPAAAKWQQLMVVNPVFEIAPRFVVALGRATPEGLRLLGTAFMASQNKLATAHHVVGGDETNLVVVAPRINSMSAYEDTADSQVRYLVATIAAVDTFRDLCILNVPGFGAAPYAMGSTDDARPGEPVVTFGFPHADTGRFVLTRHDTRVGARILVEAAGIKSKHMVMNTQARPGQSGAPVFAGDGSRVIAMVIGSYAPGGSSGILLGPIDPATLH
jgi:S1-C subfamily serine protease